jgi:AbrB family looped-hinge helix DNA binding protein
MTTYTVNNKLPKVLVRISKQGQITIPKSILKNHNIEPNSNLELEITADGALVIKKHQIDVDSIFGSLKGIVTITTEEYLRIRKEEAKLI